MSFKMKAVAAAVAFVAAAPAMATIQSGASGDGELVFSVWDTALNQGYVRDLGILQSTFLPTNATAQSFAADANLTSFLAGRDTANLRWNVVASETAGADRLFSTISGAVPPVITNGALGNGAGSMSIWVAQVNTFPTHNAPGNGSALINADTPGASVAFPGSSSWGPNIGGTFLPNAAGVGESLEFWGFFGLVSGTSGTITQTQYKFGNVDAVWTFNDGTLTFAPIPEPSTWALMLAGLLGLGAVARRRAAK